MQYTAAKKTLSTEMLITVDENEYTHVFAGEYNGDIIPNPLEVSEVERIGVESLRQELDNSSQNYSNWFQLYMKEYYQEVLLGTYAKMSIKREVDN